MTSISACRGLAGLDELEFDAAGSNTGVGGSAGGGEGGAGGFGGGSGSGGTGVPSAGCSLPASECPTVLIADTGVQVNSLTSDAERIYWGRQGPLGAEPGSIFKANKDGSEVTELVGGASLGSLVVDEDDKLLFWIENQIGSGQVRAISSTGVEQSVFLITSEAFPFASLTLGTSQQALFYTGPSTGMIARVDSSVNPSSHVIVYTSPSILETDLVVKGETLYWSEPNQIRRIQDPGGAAPKLDMPIPISGTPFDLDVGSGFVFYTLRSEQGSVMFVNEATLAVSPHVIDEPFPSHLLVTDKAVYWVSDGDSSCLTGKARVRRKTFGSGVMPETLADGLTCPSNLTYDETYVYWGAGNRIYRAPRVL